MQKITIFKGFHPEKDILSELKTDGLIGVSGGRLEVRNKLEKVRDLIIGDKLETYHAHSTINHPDTELGYAYDEERFSIIEAQELVTKSYDSEIV